MDDFDLQRKGMIEEQIAGRGLRNSRLLETFWQVPRHLFVPPQIRYQAYEDRPLPIGNNQTISQPYIVALMTGLLGLQGFENVLEIGTGSGYQAAILAYMARTVHTIERFPDLAENAALLFEELGFNNIFVHSGDGSFGWPANAPYDGIIVTAAAPHPPQPLLDQLAPDGRLVIPIGGPQGQDLQLWTREFGRFTFENIIPVSFVPLRGNLGWREETW